MSPRTSSVAARGVPVRELPAREAPANDVSEASPSWADLLDSVAAGAQRIVLEHSPGRRAVLIAESELRRLEEASSAAPVRRMVPGLLTERELEVLALVAAGRSGAQAGAELGLATNTVAQHLTSVRRKLGVSSTARAIDAVRTAGLLRD